MLFGKSCATASNPAGANGKRHALRLPFRQQVPAHQHGAQNILIAFVFHVLEEAVVASDDPAVAHAKDRGDRVVAVARIADDIGIAGADDFDGRWLFYPGRATLECIAKVAGPLEVLALTGCEHECPDARLDVDRALLEEIHHLGDHATIVGLVLPPDARRAAAADVIVEAGSILLRRWQVVIAGADCEHAADQVQRAPHFTDISVRAKVARARNIAAPRHQHAGERFSHGHRDGGIALVVLEPHIEARGWYSLMRLFSSRSDCVLFGTTIVPDVGDARQHEAMRGRSG